MTQRQDTNLNAPSAYTMRASTGCTYQSATHKKRNAQSHATCFIRPIIGGAEPLVKLAGIVS